MRDANRSVSNNHAVHIIAWPILRFARRMRDGGGGMQCHGTWVEHIVQKFMQRSVPLPLPKFIQCKTKTNIKPFKHLSKCSHSVHSYFQ